MLSLKRQSCYPEITQKQFGRGYGRAWFLGAGGGLLGRFIGKRFKSRAAGAIAGGITAGLLRGGLLGAGLGAVAGYLGTKKSEDPDALGNNIRN